MNKPNITYLPDQKVRYSYAQPSMSRRGGVRLHPAKDGLLNTEAGLQYIRTRDIGGNKLVDIVDGDTGYCVGTTSKLESEPINPAGCSTMRSGVSGTASGTLKYLPASIRVDSTGTRVYLDEDGRRIRTTDQGEAWVGAVPRGPSPVTTTNPRKGGGSVKSRAANGASAVPGATGSGGRITDDDIKSFIRALARKHGRPEPDVFTMHMMRDGREALKLVRKQAEMALARRAKRS